MEAVADAAVPDVAADADPHSAEQFGNYDEARCQVAPVTALQIRDNLLARVRGKLGRGLDRRGAFLYFEAKQSLVGFENLDVMPRFLFDQRFGERRNPAAIELSVGKARPKEFLRKLPRLLVDLHLKIWGAHAPSRAGFGASPK